MSSSFESNFMAINVTEHQKVKLLNILIHNIVY